MQNKTQNALIKLTLVLTLVVIVGFLLDTSTKHIAQSEPESAPETVAERSMRVQKERTDKWNKTINGLHLREIPFELKDGTPCTIIRGGTHAGMVGITCNYNYNQE